MALGDFSADAVHEPAPAEASDEPKQPIDLLVPQSELHNRILQYLLRRLNYSERTMTQFYSRWNANERKLQAYINLPDYEAALKQMNKTGTPPSVVSITVPYSFATIWTIVTYLVHTFCGQKPIFQVSAYKEEAIEATTYMETVLQYNADHTRLILRLIQWFLDAETYGMGALRTLWEEEKGKRTQWMPMSPGGLLAPNMATQQVRQSVEKVVFQGNKVTNIDPFMFFPDPRVPMAEVNRRGEFVFWRSFEGKHVLLRQQAQGNLKWIDNIANMPQGVWGEITGKSVRALVAEGQSSPGDPQLRDIRATPYYQVDQGTVEIVPSELGLGDSNVPEKWLFSIGNKSQIIQAEPFDYDHGRHPVAIIEPSSFGYAFGQPGTLDFLGPIQDTLSWFINSHIHNVRTALNNMFVVDPSMVELQDLKNPGPGKIIRLKRSAYGQDVKQVLQQLQVQDVTTNHMESMQAFLRMGDTLAAVNDNLRGIQEEGGRKTATEVRTSGEAGASRLAARARYISAQGMVELAEQMSLNIQQMMDQEFYLELVGQKGLENPVTITPQMVAGDFYFPVNDGTLPMDKTALLGVWKEIWMAIIQNPMLSQRYDEGKLFEYIAEIGGAKNISQFRVTLAPDSQVAGGAAAGNLAPLGTPLPGGAGAAPGAVRRPPSNGGVPRGGAGAPPGGGGILGVPGTAAAG
jgi:hypothetical protein